MYAPNNRASHLREEIDKLTTEVGNYSPLIIDRTESHQRYRKLEHCRLLDLTDIYRRLHSTTEYTLFARAQEDTPNAGP